MVPKVLEKAYAIGLRKKGFSYNEILKKVPVSKSSLSLWLRETPLSDEEKRLLKDRTSSNTNRGLLKAAAAHRANRDARDQKMFEEMRVLFYDHRTEPFFTAGIVLYWAEGTKRNGGTFLFTNSDQDTHVIMLDWLERYFQIPREQVGIRLYTHLPFAHERSEDWWSSTLSIPMSNFRKTIYKPSNRLVKKRPNYRGCPRLELSSGLYGRKMGFLTTLLVKEHRATKETGARLTE